MILNLILDLGGVILDVDYNRAVESFRQLGVSEFGSIYSKKQQSQLFDGFEKGQVTAAEFRNTIRGINQSLTDEVIDQAWNSLILSTPPERMDFLKNLGNRYSLYLLSNTNEIHIKAFTAYYETTFGPGVFENLFRGIYLSSLLGMRKPDQEIFEFVVKANSLDKRETLFIDDSPQHVEGAKKSGLMAELLPQGRNIESFIPDVLKRFL